MRVESPLHPGDVEAARLGLRRSPLWPRAERLHLLRQPTCACCAEGMHPGAAMQVHHIFPFHACILLGRPDLELDPRNLITLCESEAGRPGENHHLLVGHLGSFQSSNLEVVEAARTAFHGMAASEILQSEPWKRAAAARMKPWSELSEAERAQLAAAMNARFPRAG